MTKSRQIRDEETNLNPQNICHSLRQEKLESSREKTVDGISLSLHHLRPYTLIWRYSKKNKFHQNFKLQYINTRLICSLKRTLTILLQQSLQHSSATITTPISLMLCNKSSAQTSHVTLHQRTNCTDLCLHRNALGR